MGAYDAIRGSGKRVDGGFEVEPEAARLTGDERSLLVRRLRVDLQEMYDSVGGRGLESREYHSLLRALEQRLLVAERSKRTCASSTLLDIERNLNRIEEIFLRRRQRREPIVEPEDSYWDCEEYEDHESIG